MEGEKKIEGGKNNTITLQLQTSYCRDMVEPQIVQGEEGL